MTSSSNSAADFLIEDVVVVGFDGAIASYCGVRPPIGMTPSGRFFRMTGEETTHAHVEVTYGSADLNQLASSGRVHLLPDGREWCPAVPEALVAYVTKDVASALGEETGCLPEVWDTIGGPDLPWRRIESGSRRVWVAYGPEATLLKALDGLAESLVRRMSGCLEEFYGDGGDLTGSVHRIWEMITSATSESRIRFQAHTRLGAALLGAGDDERFRRLFDFAVAVEFPEQSLQDFRNEARAVVLDLFRSGPPDIGRVSASGPFVVSRQVIPLMTPREYAMAASGMEGSAPSPTRCCWETREDGVRVLTVETSDPGLADLGASARILSEFGDVLCTIDRLEFVPYGPGRWIAESEVRLSDDQAKGLGVAILPARRTRTDRSERD